MGAPIIADVTTRYAWSARVFDLAVATLLIVIALPVGLLIALAVALDSPGPVLFRSVRVGCDGRRFVMLKFRTMRHQGGGPRITSADDSRYTPLGRLLALTRLDEVPQLIHVLRGQMRLVGPRPELEEFVLAQEHAYREILTVPPGLTGPTQLAFADEGRILARATDPERVYTETLLPEKVARDLHYVARWGLLGDIGIIARTWFVPLRRLRVATEHHPRSARRAALVVGRAALLACATVAMVAIFALESSSPV